MFADVLQEFKNNQYITHGNKQLSHQHLLEMQVSWHYFEVGLCKGSCDDGICAVVKCTTDNAAKKGQRDIRDSSSFSCLEKQTRECHILFIVNNMNVNVRNGIEVVTIETS